MARGRDVALAFAGVCVAAAIAYVVIGGDDSPRVDAAAAARCGAAARQLVARTERALPAVRADAPAPLVDLGRRWTMTPLSDLDEGDVTPAEVGVLERFDDDPYLADGAAWRLERPGHRTLVVDPRAAPGSRPRHAFFGAPAIAGDLDGDGRDELAFSTSSAGSPRTLIAFGRTPHGDATQIGPDWPAATLETRGASESETENPYAVAGVPDCAGDRRRDALLLFLHSVCATRYVDTCPEFAKEWRVYVFAASHTPQPGRAERLVLHDDPQVKLVLRRALPRKAGS